MSNTETPADNTSALTAFRCGVLHAFGGFDTSELEGEERAGITGKKSWFRLGEVVMASLMAATIAVPAGVFFAQKTALPLAVIGAVIIFLPLFVFIPKMIQQAMQVDTEAVIAVLGKNEQIKKVFWTLFLAIAGLVLAEIADPVTAERIVGIIAGI
ncbi:hypothetical protein [Methanoregula sp.]|uniref:hypothetical protein n=1 Tax=Methanoregula sp. TaxID=2052170 RepID=UPI000CC8EDB3|nr:hypothetical protein [Methanoregula sp.]PKG32038.1 MAG: hypothetical protein CW742_10235 [Methanoregula sp.]